MDTRTRCSRAAAAILVVIGGGLLAMAVGGTGLALVELRDRMAEDMAGHLELFVLAVLLPLVVGGLLALLAARLLWGGRRGGVVLGLAWVALGALASSITCVATGNVLSAVRMIVADSATGWSVSWPELLVVTGDQGTYGSGLDDPAFWLPGAVALATIAVAVLLAGSLIAPRGSRQRTPSPGRPST